MLNSKEQLPKMNFWFKKISENLTNFHQYDSNESGNNLPQF